LIRICRVVVRIGLNIALKFYRTKPYTTVIRSQVKAIYRYGGRPVRGPKLEDFKFCMSLKSMHPEERREAWISRRAEWWANRRMAKSSEDIWDIRE
jgi:hypothetical protein